MTTDTEVSDREPRKMESEDPSVQRDASAQPEANKEEQLESSETGDRRDITNQDERQRLDYRPTVLTDWALAVSMVVNFAIIAGLVAFINRPDFSLNTETWFALNAILISVGTGTVAHLQSLFLNLSRITPFMLCAARDGALARDSILGSYFPAPSFRLILRTRNWMLLTAHIIQYLSYTVIGFKTALLYKDRDDSTVYVQEWACLALLAFYGIIQLELVAFIVYFRNRSIGLRWDPVSIADLLSLFRHSNFLHRLSESSISTRSSIEKRLGDLKIGLSHWNNIDGVGCWHGFRVIDIDSSSSEIHTDEERAPDETALDEAKPAFDGASGVAHENAENNDASPTVQTPSIRTRAISKRDLALIRYNSSWGIASPAIVYIHSCMAFLFMIAFIIEISVANSGDRGGCLGLGALPHNGAVIIFDIILTIFVAQLSGYWIDFAMVTAHTEPFTQMSTASGGPAKSTLLLNYTCSPAPAAIYRALMDKHYKVARIAVWALIHRILPTLYGIGIIVYPVGDSSSEICFNLPLSIVNIVGFAICGGLILFEAFQSPLSGRTPRDWCSIADILSWSSTTSLLQPDSFETDTADPYRDDPLHTAADGPPAERWHMQARLRLQEKRFRLGFAQVPGTESYAFGITEGEPETLPPVKVTGFSRKVVTLDCDEENGQAGTLDIVTNEHESEDIWALNPLADYAGRFWLSHWEASSEEWKSTTLWGLTTDLFDARKPYFRTWMKVAVIDMPWEKNVRARAKLKPSEYSPLYCAAWYGLEHVVEWITLQGTITEAPCGLFGHPLQAAAKRGHFAVVKLLLSAGVNVNAGDGRHESAICAAASEGHTNIVRELLAAGSLAQPFIHGVFDDRRTDPLYLAVEKGSLEIVELLLAHGATDYRALKANPASALECATQDGRLDIVKELLRHNGVLSPNSKSKVPHMFPSGFAVSQSSASELGHKDILRELAKHEMGPSDKVYYAARAGDLSLLLEGLNDGAEVDATDLQSALVSAASAGSLAVCEELLDRGANPNFKSLTAAISGKNLDVVRLLVDAGADITPPGRGPICEAVVRQQWKIVDFLAGKGADLHLALKDAVLHGDSEAFKEIIKLGAVINRHGCEILQESARGGSVVIIAYFLEMGMDVDSTSDSSRIRPLIQAIRSKKWKAMRFLLDRGADINAAALARHEQPDDAKNDIGTPAPGSIEVHGETPLAEAAKVGAENICLELIQRGAIVRTDSPAASSTPLLYAISEHLSRLFDELLQRGADPNQRGTILSAYCPKPTTPLLLAIEKRDISALHRLMAAGADVNGQDPEGLSPLHRAAGIRSSSRTKKTNDDGEDTDILKHLIHKYHADVNGPRLLNGSLPIHSAGSRGRVEHVQIMLDAGADVNALNNAGRTPMHWAAERGRWDVVELLLDRGADPQIKSTEASLQTAWDLAQAARDQPLWKVRAIKGWDNARIEALLERLEGIKEE